MQLLLFDVHSEIGEMHILSTARQYQRHGGRWLPCLVDLSDSVSFDTLEPPVKNRMNPELKINECFSHMPSK